MASMHNLEDIREVDESGASRKMSKQYRSSSSLNQCQTNDSFRNFSETEYCETCPACQKCRDDEAILPEQIFSLLQNFTMHQSLYNHICSYKVVQLVGLLTLPVRLPMEALFHNSKKLIYWLPDITEDFNWMVYTASSALQEAMEKSGTSFCFASLHLEFADVDMTRSLNMRDRAGYCSLHSSAQPSRRGSLTNEHGEGYEMMHRSPSTGRYTIDLTFGFNSNSKHYGRFSEDHAHFTDFSVSDEESEFITFGTSGSGGSSSEQRPASAIGIGMEQFDRGAFITEIKQDICSVNDASNDQLSSSVASCQTSPTASPLLEESDEHLSSHELVLDS